MHLCCLGSLPITLGLAGLNSGLRGLTLEGYTLISQSDIGLLCFHQGFAAGITKNLQDFAVSAHVHHEPIQYHVLPSL